MSQNPASTGDTTSDPQTDPIEEGGGHARETDVQESDPNADSADGLAGGMGVSSETVGPLRGSDRPGTYGTLETHLPPSDGAVPPEQSPEGLEVQPDQPPVKQHHPRAGG